MFIIRQRQVDKSTYDSSFSPSGYIKNWGFVVVAVEVIVDIVECKCQDFDRWFLNLRRRNESWHICCSFLFDGLIRKRFWSFWSLMSLANYGFLIAIAESRLNTYIALGFQWDEYSTIKKVCHSPVSAVIHIIDLSAHLVNLGQPSCQPSIKLQAFCCPATELESTSTHWFQLPSSSFHTVILDHIPEEYLSISTKAREMMDCRGFFTTPLLLHPLPHSSPQLLLLLRNPRGHSSPQLLQPELGYRRRRWSLRSPLQFCRMARLYISRGCDPLGSGQLWSERSKEQPTFTTIAACNPRIVSWFGTISTKMANCL